MELAGDESAFGAGFVRYELGGMMLLLVFLSCGTELSGSDVAVGVLLVWYGVGGGCC